MNNFIYLLGYFLNGTILLLAFFLSSIFFSNDELGVISLVLSIQYFSSQAAGIGIQFSAIYYDSLDSSENKFFNHFFNVTVFSLIISSILYLSYDFILPLLSKELIKYESYFFLYAIFASCNKVLYSSLNARREFKKLGLIYVFKSIITGIIILSYYLFKLTSFQYVYGAFLIPELVVYFYYVLMSIKRYSLNQWNNLLSELKIDLFFGIKSFWGAVLLESNTKVDLFCISYFYSDKISGIYGFVSIFSDLILQFTTLIRSYYNPILTDSFSKGISMNNKNELVNQVKFLVKKSFLYVFPVTIIIGVLFGYVLNYNSNFYDYTSGNLTFCILFLAYLLVGPLFVFFQIFGQIGKPFYQSLLFAIMTGVNILLNLLFVPLWGIEGAAIATTISYVFYFLLKFLLLRKIINKSLQCL